MTVLSPSIMILDIRTLSFVNVIVAMVLGIAMIFIYTTRRTYSGFRLWLAASACHVLGFLLLSARDFISDFLTIIVANLLIYAYFQLLLVGIRRFWDVPPRKGEVLAEFLAMLVVLVYATYLAPNANLRIVLVSILLTLPIARTAFLLFTRIQPDYRAINTALGILFSSFALMMAGRAVITFFTPSITNFFDPSPMQAVTFISTFAVTILWTISLFSLHTKRLELEGINTQKELRRMVVTDGLTGVYNNRYFYEMGHMMALHARRYNEPLSVIIFDIDFFKAINDTYGHQAGDRVLIQVAAVCRRVLRDADVLCRLGGDEFGILLPQTSLEGSQAVAERLRSAIAMEDFLEPQIPLYITISMGVSITAPGEEDVEAAMKRADTALYEVKHGPRNQVKILPPQDMKALPVDQSAGAEIKPETPVQQ
ncbi:MAG TPA: GGDEF domain-containing protein [Anaerolineaceae bacterium]|nr:GGDEF domain-containing protein [Anaerolineaceae bacterium]